MFTKTAHWSLFFIAALLAVLVAVELSQPVHASTAQQAQTPPNSCLTCHEDLFYLHDTGSQYCLTDHSARCVNCHEGNPAAMKKEDAHTGLILHPQENEGAKCRECHEAQDAQARLSKFAAADLFDKVITADVYMPDAQTELGLHQEEASNNLTENWIWYTGALVAFGFWLVLVLFSPLKP